MKRLGARVHPQQVDQSEIESRRRFMGYSAFAATMLALSGFTRFAAATDAKSPMAEGRPSATAQGAALLRAAHQILDEPLVFPDPLALKVIGSVGEQALWANLQRYQAMRGLRAHIALRSRYAEDQLAHAVQSGVKQYVILGAGLDTFAYRNPHSRLRVFEVDHPATQRWKKQRLEQAQLAAPDLLTFAPVDFENQTLAEGLQAAGFMNDEPAFFSLLGVAVYLTKAALMDTLGFVASLSAGSEIVFSYSVSSALLSTGQQAARAVSEKQVAAIGEPWISYYDPPALAADVAELGFGEVLDFGPAEANDRYFKARTDDLRVSGGSRMMTARV